MSREDEEVEISTVELMFLLGFVVLVFLSAWTATMWMIDGDLWFWGKKDGDLDEGKD